jgi:hypothetical protein
MGSPTSSRLTCATDPPVTIEEHGPHPQAEASPGNTFPPFALLWRGVALIALAGTSLITAKEIAARSSFLLPLSAVLGVAGVFAAWAGLIEVTGGEKFDDHPWV